MKYNIETASHIKPDEAKLINVRFNDIADALAMGYKLSKAKSVVESFPLHCCSTDSVTKVVIYKFQFLDTCHQDIL